MLNEKTRVFVQDNGRTAKAQVWSVSVVGASVKTTWGQVNGKMQETTQAFEAVNVGKSNEKPPELVAKEWAERQILLKTRQGYAENGEAQASISGLDFSNLPRNLRFFKPQHHPSAYMKKRMASNSVWYLRKRDGVMHCVSYHTEGEAPDLYTSLMAAAHKDEPDTKLLDRYEQLKNDLTDLNLPPETILLGEIVSRKEKDGYGFDIDDFEYVGTATKSLKDRSLLEQSTRGEIGFCIWDIAYWDGECWLRDLPLKDRYQRIWEIVQGRKSLTCPEVLVPEGDRLALKAASTVIDELEKDHSDNTEMALELCKELGWEGWVVVDPEGSYADKYMSFHGKPERPKNVCKWKPVYEADFIVRWDPESGIGQWGKGKKSGGVGSVMAYLWDPVRSREIQICKVGGGLTDELVRKYANKDLYPMVWEVQFASWTPKGALRHPEFFRQRDKKPEECSMEQAPEHVQSVLRER